MKKAAGTLLLTEDGSVVLQRRTSDAPTSPNMLSLFGGGMEGDETPIEGARRELSEEISLDTSKLEMSPLAEFGHKHEYFYIFSMVIPTTKFDVYEGTGAELYDPEQALERDDLFYAARRSIEILLNKEY